MSKPKGLHGWKGDDGKFYLSLRHWHERWAANAYDTSSASMAEASKRRLPVIWEDPAAIDEHGAAE